MANNYWTPTDDETLLRLLGTTTLSARQIGEAVGRSKNAVIGRVHRLGYSLQMQFRTGTAKLPPVPVYTHPSPSIPVYPNVRRGERCGRCRKHLAVDSGLCQPCNNARIVAARAADA